MKAIQRLLSAAILLVGVAGSAAAHHVAEVESDIYKRDIYFQPDIRAAPSFKLETFDAKEVRLDDFRGKVVVLDFIYARCKDVCPLQSQLLSSIQKLINRTPMHDLVEFVTVATDTEDPKSTADLMRRYGADHGFDPSNWMFLYGGSASPDAGIRTAEGYGLNFKITKDGDQVHGVVTFVIDQSGRLRARFHGLKFDPVDLIMFVNALTNEPPEIANFEHTGNSVSANRAAVSASPRWVPPLWFYALLAAVILALTALAVLVVRGIGQRRN